MGKGKSGEEELLASLVGILLAIFVMIPVLTVYSILANGFIISNLWAWYMVPLGLPSVTLVHAYGIALVANVLTHQHGVHKNKDSELSGEKVVTALLSPWLVFVTGYILHAMFMGA